MKIMKRSYLLIPVALFTSLVLAGCTPGETSEVNNTKISFDSKKLTAAPQWDLTKLVQGSWGSGNKTAVPLPTERPSDLPEAPTDGGTYQPDASTPEITDPVGATPPEDSFLYNYVSFYDTSTACRITGQIIYTESYKAERGDDFNSKDYLYSLVPPTENTVVKESKESINGVEYVVGNYTQPKEWNSNSFHKTAVRVFSSPVTVDASTGFASGELGNYNSDLTKGLPTVSIDFACADEKNLTDAQWKAGIANFKLLFDVKKETSDVPSTDSVPEPTEKSIEDAQQDPNEK